jgi:ATP-binding cassette subfamily C (CFTR/MRP) protein 1
MSSLENQHKTEFWLSLFFSILAALGLGLLLLQEQQRSHRASDLAALYLLASVLCDVILLASFFRISRNVHTSLLALLRCCIRLTLFILECCAKQHPVSGTFSTHQSPEENHSILSRIFFIWINPILLQGYTNILGNQDLPPLNSDMKPESTRKTILHTWSQRG